MNIGAAVHDKMWPSVGVGLMCQLWTIFVYMSFLSWLEVSFNVVNKPIFLIMPLAWALGVGLLPLVLWVAWLEVGQVRAFLVIHTLIFVVITVWVIWLLLSFVRPDSWTCIHSPQFDLLCLFWFGLLATLFVAPFELLVDDNTVPRRDLILIVNFAVVLNFNALPWIANLHCGGYFLDENWRNFDLLFYAAICLPVILLLSVICIFRWRRQSPIQKWLIGGLLTVSSIWFAFMIGAIVWFIVERY